MSIRSFSVSFLAPALVVALSACGNGAGTGAAGSTDEASSVATSTATSARSTSGVRSTKTATVAHNLVSPDGKIDGVLFTDGSIVRVPPGTIAADALVAGDSVDVEAETKVTHSGESILVRPLLRKGGAVVADLSVEPPHEGRGPGFHGHGGRLGPFGAPHVDLQDVTVKGTVDALLTRHDGSIDAIVLKDGSTARVFGHGAANQLSIHVGDSISIMGRGTSSLSGTGLLAESIVLPSGTTQKLDAPPRPVAVDEQVTVEKALINPFGDVDTLVFSNGHVTHLPPFANLGAKVSVGQTLHVVGTAFGSSVHADSLVSASGEALLVRPTEPPQMRTPPSHPELADVDESSTIARVLEGPHSAETLVLTDGAIVKLGPRLGEQAASELRVGAMVHVAGKGGTYASGTSLFAKTLTTASGQTYSAPEGHHEGPPGECADGPMPSPARAAVDL